MKLTREIFDNPEKFATSTPNKGEGIYYIFDNLYLFVRGTSKNVYIEIEKPYPGVRFYLNDVIVTYHSDGGYPSYQSGIAPHQFTEYHYYGMSHRINGPSFSYLSHKKNVMTKDYYIHSFEFDKPRYLSMVL